MCNAKQGVNVMARNTTQTKGNAARAHKGTAKAFAEAKTGKAMAAHNAANADVQPPADVVQTADSGGAGETATHTVAVGQLTHTLQCTTLAALRDAGWQATVPADAGKAEPLAGKASSAKPTACQQLLADGHTRLQNAALWGGKGAGAGHLANWASGIARWLNSRPSMLPDGYRAAVATGTRQASDGEGNVVYTPVAHVALVNDAQ